MAIKNATTTIEASKTVGEIQQTLGKAGAKAVMVEYGPDGVPSAVAFRIDMEGQLVSFLLPANVEGVFSVLRKERRTANTKVLYQQACRVAWRIVKHWLDNQLAMIQSGNAELAQVFLPYAQATDGRTFWEHFRKNPNQLLLTVGAQG